MKHPRAVHATRLSRLVPIALLLVLPSALAEASGHPRQVAEPGEGFDLAAVVEALVNTVAEEYVDTELGYRTADHVAARLDEGAYAGLDADALARALTADLRAASGDLHYRVTHEPERFAFLADSGSGEFSITPEEVEREARAENYGFTRLERLPGNVGYLKLDTFSWQLHSEEKAHAAMAFLADCDAVIVDLRDNGGGHSEMERLLVSYFFPAEPKLHLSTFHYRKKESEEVWTLPELPGRRIAEAPVYVLTSDSTFSAAEGFAYMLAVRGRAKIVGGRSSGGANPINYFPLADGFVAKVPIGRGEDAVTGTTWEGTGVPVDVACPPREALERSHLLALEALLEGCAERDRAELTWLVECQRARVHPVAIEESALESLAGSWGGARFEVRCGKLWCKAPGDDWRPTIALAPDTFMMEGDLDMRLVFEKGAAGERDRLFLVYRDGRKRFFHRG
jgi:C-terminal processing protease CtpA/Prc